MKILVLFQIYLKLTKFIEEKFIIYLIKRKRE